MPRRTGAYFIVLSVAVAALGGCTPARARPRVNATESLRAEAAAASELAQATRQIVRRGQMQVEVENVSAARASVERAVELLGGRVAHLESKEDRAEYSLRVPSDRLDRLMDSVATLGNVERRTVSAVDVTEQVVDVEARLEALRASRNRLQQLLARSSSVQDVVAVERELARVQGELESLEGRLNSLRSQVAFSELTVRLDRRRVLGPLGLVFVGAANLVEKLVIWR